MEPEIIELGDGGNDHEQEAVRREPARYRRSVAVVAGLLLTALSGAAAPVTPMLTQVAELALGGADGVPASVVDPVRDLLVVRSEDALSAYELDDGSLRWRLTYPPGGRRDFAVSRQVPDVLMVSEGTVEGSTPTAAVDMNTGAVRWSTNQYVRVVGEYGLEGRPPSAPAEGIPPVDSAEPVEILVRDLSTGRVRWALRGTPFVAVDEAALEAWSISKQGVFTVHDLRDGRLLRRGAVAFPPGTPELATVYGGMLALSARLPDGAFLETRYDIRTLRVVAAATTRLRFACGDYLCEVDGDGGTRDPVAVLDRETLAVRYRLEPNVQLIPSAQGAITVRADGSPLLGVPAEQMIDLADGRTLLDLSGWRAQFAFDESPAVLLARQTPDGVQLARIEDGRVRLLGTLPATAQRCFHNGQWIACVHDGNRLGIWRIGTTAP
ncbi:hypothetical protein AB0B31_13875 [Catellatospora citrea]|uniref:hypothetical protein n=1 Tax=Catellatospora citrea TaxID=53366 RepID=UPI00340A29FE